MTTVSEIRDTLGDLLSDTVRDYPVDDTLVQDNGWWDADALLDMDLAAQRFRFNGASYDKAGFLSAIGGSETGGVYTIGPYVDPAGSNLLTNGTFDSDVSGWTGVNGSIANVSAALELTGGGVSQASAYQHVTKDAGRAVRLRGTMTRVSGGPGVFLALSGVTGLTGTSFQSAALAAVDTPTVFDVLYGGDEFANTYVGIKQNGTSAGKSRLDSAELKYALPFATASYTVYSGRVRGLTPASASGNKVVLQLGDDSERNRIRVVYDGTGHLRLITTFNNTEQSNLDLGAPGDAVAFDVSFSAQSNLVFAQLNGGAVLQDVAAGMMGPGKLWVGRSFTGETFDGTITRVQLYAEYLPQSDLWLEGDSYVAGAADGTSLWDSLQTQTSRAAFYTGAGGSTVANQRDRILSHTGFAARNTLVWWDGSANGYDATTANDVARYAAGIAALGHNRYVIVTPLQTPASVGAQNTATAALRTALLAAYPNNCYDAQTFVDGVSDPYQASPNDAHLKDSTMDLVAADLSTWMSARGM